MTGINTDRKDQRAKVSSLLRRQPLLPPEHSAAYAVTRRLGNPITGVSATFSSSKLHYL